MNKTGILLDLIELLYRESEILGELGDSKDLATNLLEIITPDTLAILNSDESTPEEKLRDIIVGLTTTDFKDKVDPSILERDLIFAYGDESYLQDVFKEMTNDIGGHDEVVKKIKLLRKRLTTVQSEIGFTKYINRLSYTLNKERKSISDMREMIRKTSEDVAKYEGTSEVTDGVLNVVNFDDNKKMDDAINIYKNEIDGRGKFITGWQDFNNMTQGGLRRGEFVTISATQGGYKTGFTLSLFSQMIENNDPELLMTEEEIEQKKIPLALWVTFEDKESDKIIEMFRYLYYDEHGVSVEIENFTDVEIREYIKKRLMGNKFKVIMMRVNPSDWTYKTIFALFAQLESQGYSILLAGFDYLSHVPTTGCINTGPMGTDLRDLFRRVKNHIMAKNICFLTPHQLATSVLELKRSGLADHEILPEIVEKGHYEKSRQLGQEIDLEVHVNIVDTGSKSYLHVVRGKHRLPTIVQKEYKSFFLPFPPKDRIPSDLGKKKISTRKLKDENNYEI